MTDIFDYDSWPSRAGQGWGAESAQGDNPYDLIDFHVDLGCGKLPKGRIGIDRNPAEGVDLVMDLDPVRTYGIPPEPGRPGWEMSERSHGRSAVLVMHSRSPQGEARTLEYAHPESEFYDFGHGSGRLPFESSSIKSIISHHCLEHVGNGFMALIDEVYRVLEPGGILRAITPLFPSRSAVEDPDHRRYFMTGTWDSFCGTPGDTPTNCWLASFSVPYTKARFELVDKDFTPPVSPAEQWGPSDCRELRVALKAMK